MAMKISLAGPLILAAGVLLGAVSAVVSARALGTGEPAPDGIWRQRTAVSASLTSPYGLASYVLEGRLPPSAGQLVEFAANTDSDGENLSPDCVYTLTTTAESLPHWWSLGAEGGGASSLAAAPAVIGLSGGEVIIRVSATPQPGNWLPVPRGRSFVLVYSGAVDVTTAGLPGDAPPFAMTRSGCP